MEHRVSDDVRRPGDSDAERTNRLVGQTAVARSATEEKRKVLVTLLRDAVDEAEQYAARKKLATELPAVRALVARVADCDQ